MRLTRTIERLGASAALGLALVLGGCLNDPPPVTSAPRSPAGGRTVMPSKRRLPPSMGTVTGSRRRSSPPLLAIGRVAAPKSRP